MQKKEIVTQVDGKEKPFLRKLSLSFLTWLIAHVAQLEIDEESKQNLEHFNTALLKESVVLYGYHSSFVDALILPLFIAHHLDNADQLLAPVTIKHYQGFKKHFLSIMTLLTGTQFLPVVRKKDEALVSPDHKQALFRQLATQTSTALQRPGSVYGVAPMGTRAQELHKDAVNPGFVKIATKYQTPLVPVAFHQDEQQKLRLAIGEVLPPPDKNSALSDQVDFYMAMLAQLLPEHLRSDYK